MQKINGGSAAAARNSYRGWVIGDLNPVRPSRCKAERFIIAKRVMFVRGAHANAVRRVFYFILP